MTDSHSPDSDPVAIEVHENGETDVVVKEPDAKEAPRADVVPASDLTKKRAIWIVTTAGLPWRTGTSLNPLMRALYLVKDQHQVTLCIPWLPDRKQRSKLYGPGIIESKEQQEEWIREYCRTRASCPEEEPKLRILFWEGKYVAGFGSIFPTEDICRLVPSSVADVAILEEPEHLNWWRTPEGNQDALGWAHKFQHVVGVLHTNYEAYIKQYGMGTSLLTAPALHALSSLVVKAYCHKVIRLSATLPQLAADIEVTCNVHGVRPEFLEPASQSTKSKVNRVYFIGKLIWAKGFDKVLHLQDRYHKLMGKYFEMDIYGGGEDEDGIQRAFHGRFGGSNTPSSSDEEDDAVPPTSAQGVFGSQGSLRDLLTNSGGQYEATANMDSDDDDSVNSSKPKKSTNLLNDLSEKAITTGTETAGAAYRVIENLMAGLPGMGEKESDSSSEATPSRGKGFSLGPTLARFKWRHTPIPARFQGVLDHIEVRDLTDQKVFLNMSTTEVLCTTSAEALAMGKFVILPKHPSNEFFYEFPNCLAYEDMDDCLSMLQYALTHDPEPLTDYYGHKLSWEGATERLYKCAAITKEEQIIREEKKVDKVCLKSAEFHVGTTGKSKFISDLFSGRIFRPNSGTSTPVTAGCLD